jgi:cation diffusion facilitator family transporter
VADSDKAVYAAIAGNVAVAAVKFIAAAVSGSSVMFAEAIHSVVDTGNDSLLVFGRHRSRRPADADHPVGHGQELYFWSFIVAILVFAVGAGFSLYEGISRMIHPGRLEDPRWNYIVLGLAALFEGGSLVVGYRQFRREARGRSWWRLLRESKDPPTFSVVLEDTAALIGIAFAVAGIWLAHHFGNEVFDAAASIAVGCLLTAVSILLIRESKGLLLGEAMSRAATEDIRRIAQNCPGVAGANRPLTLYFGPEFILLALEVEFLPGVEVATAIDRIEAAIRGKYPKIRRIYIEAEALSRSHAETPR